MSQWGESFLKLKYTPSSAGGPATLQVVGHWTPWTDLARTGQVAAHGVKLAGVSALSEAIKPVGGGMNMSLKDARLVPMVSDQGTHFFSSSRRWPPAIGRMKIGDRLVRPASSRSAFAWPRERTESPFPSRQGTLAGLLLQTSLPLKRTAQNSPHLRSG